MKFFSQITPTRGRQLPKDWKVVILPQWDIVNAVRKEKKTKFKTKEDIK